MIRKSTIIATACAIASLGVASTSQAASCDINFDRSSDLQRLTYAEQCVGYIANNHYFKGRCTASTEVWVQQVDVPSITPTRDGLYALLWHDTSIGSCISSDGCFGKLVGATCTTVNHNAVPRRLASIGSEWLRLIRVIPNVNTLTSKLSRIRVVGTNPIDVWIQQTDNNWLVYNDLHPGLHTLNGPSNTKTILLNQNANRDAYVADDFRFEF